MRSGTEACAQLPYVTVPYQCVGSMCFLVDSQGDPSRLTQVDPRSALHPHCVHQLCMLHGGCGHIRMPYLRVVLRFDRGN